METVTPDTRGGDAWRKRKLNMRGRDESVKFILRHAGGSNFPPCSPCSQMKGLARVFCLVACFVGAQGFLPAQPFFVSKGRKGVAAATSLPLRNAIGCRLRAASRKRLTVTSMTGEESLQRLVDSKGRRYIIVGGKGGVGKTSTSAALAVKLADEGLKTLVISTDPAHSLGDALMTDLSKGKVTPVAEQGGNLYALEVDLKEAIEEFKSVIKSLKGSEEVDSIASKLGLSEITDIFDVPPPGADELVALSKIISLVEEGEAKTALGQVGARRVVGRGGREGRRG
eukprot:748590-Hanusia_phi.AAC.2